MGSKYLLVLALLAVHSVVSQNTAEQDGFNPRIYYGDDAEKGEFPFMVRLSDDYGHWCGGALISSRIVITAGHCLFLDGELLSEFPIVTVGDHSGKDEDMEQRMEVMRIIPHPDYSDRTLENDIGLVILKEAVQITETVTTISLPEDERLYKEGSAVTVIGWGGTEESYEAATLQKHVYEISNQEECKSFWEYTIYEGMVCTGKPPLKGHAWTGDSGGPLFTQDASGKFVLLALTSWGTDVATPDTYDVNTDVSYYMDWIKEQSGVGLDESLSLELQGGVNHGVVLVTDYSGTSTICNDGIGQDEVSGVCRHLGYSYGILKHLTDYQTGKKNTIVPELPGFGKTNLKCSSEAKDVSGCTFNSYPGEVPCFGGQQLAVQCAGIKWRFQVTDMDSKITITPGGVAKGKVSCRVEAEKYDMGINLQKEVEVGLINVKEDGDDLEYIADMMYKKKMGVFMTKLKPKEQVEHDCFVCVAVLKHDDDFLAIKGEDNCNFDAESNSFRQSLRSLFRKERSNRN